MTNVYFRLIGLALLLDSIIVVLTVPLTRLMMSLLLPTNLMSSTGILWTYGLVIFVVLVGAMLLILWIFQAWYAHLFTFWELLIAMVIVMVGIVWWNKGL